MKKKEAWKILGIEETDDKSQIKKAYRERLTVVHPEDDAEGFMRLREAYEAAMSDEEPEEDAGEGEEETPVFSPEGMALAARLLEMYDHFDVRINKEEWRKLFEEEFFVSLETGDEAFQVLMRFLMDHIRLPHKVMKLIIDHFEIVRRRGELIEEYPERFIDFLIRNGTYQDRLDYELFDPAGKDVDEYIETFYRMSYNGEEGNDEEEEQGLEKLKGFESRNPLLDLYLLNRRIRKLNVEWRNGPEQQRSFREACEKELEEVRAEQEELMKKFPGQPEIMRSVARICSLQEDAEGLEKIVDALLEKDPEELQNLMLKGRLLYLKKEFKESADTYMEILQKDRFYEQAYYAMHEANEAQIRQYREAIQENPEDDEKKLELGWCLFQNDRYNEALEAIRDVDPEGKEAYVFHNLSGRLFLYTGRLEEAAKHLIRWGEEIKKIDPEAKDEESVKRRSRMGLSLYLLAEARFRQKKYDEARQLLDQAENSILLDGMDVDLQELRIKVEFYDNKLPECFRLTEDMLKREPFNCAALLFQAKCLYRYDQNREAWEVLNRLLEINPYEPDAWLYRCYILQEADQNEDALKLIEDCEKRGVLNERLLEQKGRLYHHFGEEEKVLEAFRSMLEYAHEEGADPEDKKENLFRAYAGVTASLSRMKRLEEAKEVFEEAFEELGYDPDFWVDYTELLVRMDKLEEAKAFAFARLEERRGMKDDWDSQILRMNLCCFCGNEGDVETAYRLFREGIEAFPRDLAAYHCMAEVLLEHGREKEALKLLSSGMKSVPESAMNHLGLYLMIAAKVYDGNLAGNEDLVGKMRDYIADDSREIKDWDTEYGRRGDFYFAVGEDDKALEMAEEKLKLSRSIFYYFSNAHGAWYAKGKVYSRQGNHEKAAECYRKAIEIFGHHKLYEDCLADELAFLEEYK